MRSKLAMHNAGANKKRSENLQQSDKSRPPLKSKAFRAPEDPSIESKQMTQDASAGQAAQEELTAADETRLTTEEISLGVEEAREALNAPPMDLLAFEEALKKKHDEYKAAGITPRLTTPKLKDGSRKAGNAA